jgi:hypothetical protein
MKATRANKKKLQELLEAGGYRVRFEKGNFNGGYCVLNTQPVVIINRFYPLDAQINLLIELTQRLQLDEAALSDAQSRLLHSLKPETANS